MVNRGSSTDMSYLPFVTGTASLTAGVAQIVNSAITPNTTVFTSNTAAAGTIGILSVLKYAGFGFTVTSSNVLDTSTITYLII